MIVVLILVAFLLYSFYYYLFPASTIDCRGKCVLISGCDTGVGRASAIDLDRQGLRVFASVLNRANINSLRAELSSRAIVFRLDITNKDDIANAYSLVEQTSESLHGLVNNAGVLTHGCIDWTPMSTMNEIMDVNFFGHVAMTKTFLPLLIRQANSRVVNVVSAAGFFSFPNTSAYSASKHGEMFGSNCLTMFNNDGE